MGSVIMEQPVASNFRTEEWKLALIYQTTRRHIQEDRYLDIHRLQNAGFHGYKKSFNVYSS
jgi:hypothetical protein